MITPEQMKEWRDLAENAAPLPYAIDWGSELIQSALYVFDGVTCRTIATEYEYDDGAIYETLPYLEAAANNFPDAIDAIDALRAENARLREAQAQFWNAKKLRQDDDAHWYIIPADDARKFDAMMDARDWDGIDEHFTRYMVGGWLGAETFYIPEG